MNKYNEIELIQNPAIGSIIIWKFLLGYKSIITIKNFEILFIVLPILLNSELRKYILSTQKRSGFTKVIEKIRSDRKTDIIYRIANNAIEMRDLTMESIQIGILTDMFTLEENFCILIKNYKIPPISKNIKDILDTAEKLGLWLSKLTQIEIESLLKVRF